MPDFDSREAEAVAAEFARLTPAQEDVWEYETEQCLMLDRKAERSLAAARAELDRIEVELQAARQGMEFEEIGRVTLSVAGDVFACLGQHARCDALAKQLGLGPNRSPRPEDETELRTQLGLNERS